MRKVDYILGSSADVGNTKSSIVYRALYGDIGPTERVPGVLTEYLAALAVAMGSRIRFVTTNFDNMLERALSDYGETASSMTIGRAEQWWETVERGERAVMHAHGLVTPGGVEEPIILSESDFREHGRVVQDLITKVLETSDVIFVGVSMADPNLVGPLSRKSESSDTHAYLITVPDVFPGVAWPKLYKYALLRCKVLSSLGLETVLMKSYSQTAQVITELGRAIAEPSEYLARSEVRYGGRLNLALNDAYERVGPDAPGGRDITDRLAEALDGPVSLIRAITERWEEGFLQDHNISTSDFLDENFGLYLWLRVREESRSPSYAITLIGSSISAHRQLWSFQRTVRIEPDTGFYAAESLFQGKAISAGPLNCPSKWRSANAMPLYFRRPDDSFGSLPIGAVTLNSTGDACSPDAHGSHDPTTCVPSAISYFSTEQKVLLKNSVHAAGLLAIYGVSLP
jgi:hypothetical protein